MEAGAVKLRHLCLSPGKSRRKTRSDPATKSDFTMPSDFSYLIDNDMDHSTPEFQSGMIFVMAGSTRTYMRSHVENGDVLGNKCGVSEEILLLLSGW